MPETITLHALDLSGETTLKLFLRKDDGTLLNTGGDDLAEIGSSGVFTATLAESRSGLGDLSYRICLATETADNLLIDGFLPETETTIGASGTAVLDPAITAQINAIEDDCATAVGYLTTLVARLTANAATAIQNLWHMITGTGASSKYTAAALENAPSSTGGLTTEQNTALLGIAAAVSGGSKVEASGRVAAGGKVTAYVGDDFKVSRGTALTIPVSDPAGTLQTKLTTITAANLRFAVSAPGKAGSLITGTISGITTSGSGADRLCLIAVEITNCGASLPPGEQYFYQIDQIQGSTDDFVEVEGKFMLKQRARAV